MAGEILSTTVSTDQEKFLAAKLISRSRLKLVAASMCEPIKHPKGSGLTGYFIRYERMNVPLVPISEGVDPSNSSFAPSQVSVTLDQWGDVVTLTDVAQLTTAHPLLQTAIELLSDNAQRVIDREIQIVWLANTNVQYHDGGVASRSALAAADIMNDEVLHKARVTLVNAGAPPRGGPSGGIEVAGGAAGGGSGMKGVSGSSASGSINGGQHYVGLAGPEVMADIVKTGTSFGTFASVATYSNQKALYNMEVGMWLNVRWVETNFIPRFAMLGNNTAAVASGNAFGADTPVVTAVDGGGSLTSGATYYYKVTRKDLTRGFEEEISLEHTTAAAATGNNESFTFNFSGLSAGYVYNLYFGSATGDSNLKLHTENIEVGDTVTVTSVPASTETAPANPASGVTVHPVYVLGAEAVNWVSLSNLEVILSSDNATTDNPLKLRRTVGYKYLGKAMIRDSSRLLRIEVASTY